MNTCAELPAAQQEQQRQDIVLALAALDEAALKIAAARVCARRTAADIVTAAQLRYLRHQQLKLEDFGDLLKKRLQQAVFRAARKKSRRVPGRGKRPKK